jgi:hypothetical protein
MTTRPIRQIKTILRIMKSSSIIVLNSRLSEMGPIFPLVSDHSGKK